MSANLMPDGVIDPTLLYTHAELCRRLGWTTGSWRAARRQGLRVRYVGKRCFVLGRDAVEFIDRAGRDEK